jgi:hypothetical protein
MHASTIASNICFRSRVDRDIGAAKFTILSELSCKDDGLCDIQVGLGAALDRFELA